MGMVLVTLLVMLLVVAGMAIGVMFGRKPLTGSCGGVGKALDEEDYVCDICGGDESKCEEQQQVAGKSEKLPADQPLAYEVTLNKNNKDKNN
jgi:hypothetical protein